MKSKTQSDEVRWENGGCLPIPLASIWITGKCPLKCKHCYEGQSKNQQKHLSKEKIIPAMQILSPYVNSFSFMGGEPTTHPDLAEICEAAKKLGKYTLLVSNGMAITEKMIQKLIGKIDCIKLGMDGVTAQTHDIIRGKGTFQKAMRVWELLAPKIPTMCKFTINSINLSELPKVADFYRNLGAKRLVLNRWLNIGNGGNYWNRRFALTNKQLDEINHYIFHQLKPNYHIFPVSRSCSLDNGCQQIPARTYYITSNGAIAPCIFSGHLAIGNIYEPNGEINKLLKKVNELRLKYSNLHESQTQKNSVIHNMAQSSLQFCPH